MSRESLFKNHEDYLNWDKYIENCEFLEGLDHEQKNAAKEALAYLRALFGEEFLTSGERPSEQPSALMVANRTLGNILKQQSVVLMNPCCKFLNPTLAHQFHQAVIYSE